IQNGGSAPEGGGRGSRMTITGSTISGNKATEFYGGGICNSIGEITITNSTISDNRATGIDGSGGGIENDDQFTLTNSTISGNRASKDGGGLLNRSSFSSPLTCG